MPTRVFLRTLTLLLLASSPLLAAEPDTVTLTNPHDNPAPVPTDSDLLSALDLDYPGLDAVKRATLAHDLPSATKAVADFYRHRLPFYATLAPFSPDLPPLTGPLPPDATALLSHTGNYAPQYWLPNGQLDLRTIPLRFKERLYYWDSLGTLYQRTHDERIAAAWVNLFHSYVSQISYPESEPYWRTMHIGIQLRSAFPIAFKSFLPSPAFTDADILSFLKRMLQQTRYLRQVHNRTSNQLTFEMAGLYTSGVFFPEFKDAADWRRFAADTALADLHTGWLPDGMTIELSPGYGQFFSNYFVMLDLAKAAGRLDESHLASLLPGIEPLYETYIKIMTPDRLAPTTNDNDPVDVPKLMHKALERYPHNPLFQWAATDDKQGTPPTYTSLFLPYAGFAVMRSDWSRSANLLYFDAGPLGYRHAHQDKLEVLLWSYGRPLLFDPGRGHYDTSPPRFQNYALDTFSHSTVLVDHRPQRRPWYTNPHPSTMPYREAPNCQWQSTPTSDYAAGLYDESYGLPGESDADPFKPNSNFDQGWSHPATHHRRVLFYKPDLFVVVDTLIPNDTQPHTYDARWQLASTHTELSPDHLTLTTTDPNVSNLAICPLDTQGLTVKSTSAQETPELLGWNAADTPHPATTLQHLKTSPGPTQFVTLLLPLKPNHPSPLTSVQSTSPSSYTLTLEGDRHFQLDVPPDPTHPLSVTPIPH